VVTVSAITDDGLTAICTDRTGVEVRVPLFWQRAKGFLPQVGENWLVSQDVGQWTFQLFLGTDAGQFPVPDDDEGGGGPDSDPYDYPVLKGPAWDPAYNGMVLASGDPFGVSVQPAMLKGVVYMSRLFPTESYTLNGVVIMFGDAPVSPGTPHFYVGFYDRDLNLLTDSPDWGSLAYFSDNSAFYATVNTPFTTTPGQWIYAACLSVFTGDQPQPWCFAPSTSSLGLSGPTQPYGVSFAFNAGDLVVPFFTDGPFSTLPDPGAAEVTDWTGIHCIWMGAAST
jgi:hypothetical protein